ncbi:hypothetical protein FOVSG1_001717 [Fusarium oxysporum f. sp. vasinfectum]
MLIQRLSRGTLFPSAFAVSFSLSYYTRTNSVRSISKYRLTTLDASSLANNLVTPYSQTDRRSVNSSKDNSPS